ncbi:MAG TPA: rod shape-determining protein MreD [Clostridia bacterium]|nr:rod shape-determining protein MreD [Clostridia bacterium]
MKIKILVYTVCIFVIVLLQSTILDYIKIFNIKPDLSVIFVVSVALLRGNVEGAVVGFFCGLLHDMVTGRILGFYALLGMYLGLIIGSVNKRLYRENFLVIIFFTFISSIGYELAVCLLNYLFIGKIDLIYSVRRTIFPESVYNSIVSVFIYVFVIKLNDRFQSVKKISRKY